MASTDEFATACKAAAKGLRRVPADLRKDLAGQVQTQVAAPLAGKIAAAATGPWASVLSKSVKARKLADPTIVVGGANPKTRRGKATPRQLVYGVEFGAGKRLTAVPRTVKHRGYRRYSTTQFVGRRAPFVFPTIGRNVDWVLDTFADLTLATLTKGVNTDG